LKKPGHSGEVFEITFIVSIGCVTASVIKVVAVPAIIYLKFSLLDSTPLYSEMPKNPIKNANDDLSPEPCLLF
jgi:hypothetical protein